MYISNMCTAWVKVKVIGYVLRLKTGILDFVACEFTLNVCILYFYLLRFPLVK